MTERYLPPHGAPSDQPDLSVLVASYNTEHLLAPMWDALMSDFTNAAKGLVRGRGLQALTALGQHAWTLGTSLVGTRLGSAPSR